MKYKHSILLLTAILVQLSAGAQDGPDRNLLTGNFNPAFLSEHILSLENWHPCPTIDEPEDWEKLPEHIAQGYVKKGENRLDYNWPVIPATAALDFTRNGNRTNYEEVSFDRRSALADLVMAELFERKGRFTDQIINGIWAISEETYWGISAHLGAQEKGAGLPDVAEPTVDLFAAETSNLLAWTLYLVGSRLDTVSPLIRERIEYEIDRRILIPNFERDDFWWMGYTGEQLNNWTPWICSNWISSILLMEEDPELRTEYLHKAMSVLDHFLNPYPADGGCDEGPGYWNKAGGSLFDCLYLLHSASGGSLDIFGESLIKEIGRFIYKAYISQPYYINFADASALIQGEACLIYRYGKMIEDPAMMGFASFLAEQQELGKSTIDLRFGQLGLREIPAVFILEELLEYPAQEPLISDFWLPDIQVMAARSFPGSNQGIYVAAKGGHNDESHNHNDVGNFIVYLDGLPAIIDIGVETYTAKTFSQDRYDIWTMQSAYHSLPTVNGVMQQNGREFHAENVSFKADKKSVSFKLDIAGAYPDASYLKSLQRSISLKRKVELLVSDYYSFRKEGNSIVVNLVTNFSAIHVPEASQVNLVNNDLKKQLSLYYDKKYTSVNTEMIRISDERLKPVWGEYVTRIQLHANIPGTTEAFKIVFREE